MHFVRSCIVCGSRVGMAWAVDHFNETLCRTCVVGPRCWGCDAVTGGIGERATTTLSEGRLRCRRCSRGAVDSAAEARPVIALVRPLLQSFGIRLVNRVRVELGSPDELRRQAGRHLHGLTVIQHGGPMRSRALQLKVVDGLPATVFGSVLAHEMGHAWLAGCPDVGRDEASEEGICELVASWWLRERGGRLAAHRLDTMTANPDPVYGGGFREAQRRAQGRSPAEVVAAVTRFGRL